MESIKEAIKLISKKIRNTARVNEKKSDNGSSSKNLCH